MNTYKENNDNYDKTVYLIDDHSNFTKEEVIEKFEEDNVEERPEDNDPMGLNDDYKEQTPEV